MIWEITGYCQVAPHCNTYLQDKILRSQPLQVVCSLSFHQNLRNQHPLMVAHNHEADEAFVPLQCTPEEK